ncbi:hypothetical protein VTO42DRAFT_5197 [Malbranchea cinnamomea]
MFLQILHPPRNSPAASRSSPQSSNKASPSSVAFKPQGAADPFLARPPSDIEQVGSGTGCRGESETSMEQNSPRRPPGQAQGTSDSLSKSPAALQAPDFSRNPSENASHHLSPGSHLDWLSPADRTDNRYADLSSYTSPHFDNSLFLQPDLSFTGALEDLSWAEPQHQDPPSQSTGNGDPQPATTGVNPGTASRSDRQLLSPVPTNTPSPQPVEQRLHPSAPALDSGHINSPLSISSGGEVRRNASPNQLPVLETQTNNETLDVKGPGSAGLPPSPIVKVSSYTRGDSPEREGGLQHQASVKRNRNAHLAPTQDSSSSDSEGDEASVSSGHRRTVSVPASALRSDEGAWLANPSTGQKGLDPLSRGDTYVLSPKEMMARQKLEEKNAEVEQWLSYSEANSEIEDNGTRGFRSRVARRLSIKSRRRSRSTGDPSMASRGKFTSTLDFDDSAIPGPGVLLEVDSEEDDDDEEGSSKTSDIAPESPPAQVEVSFDDAASENYFPPTEHTDFTSEELLFRAGPWHDPPRIGGPRDTKEQPETSNAAIARYNRQADSLETASLAVTIGSQVRSDFDAESIIGPGGRFSNLHIGTDDKKKSRRNSFLRFLPKGTFSNAKRKFSQPMETQYESTESLEKRKSNDSKESSSSPSVPSLHKPSISRPQPSLNTSGAVMAMTGQIAPVGGGSSAPASAASPKLGSSHWSHIRRSRSKSEIPKGLRSHGAGGLLDLMTSVGGPPVPTLASPVPEKTPTSSPTAPERPVIADGDDDDENEDDEAMDDKGVVMEFPIVPDLIVPTLEGFRTQVRRLNPRLQPALVERIAKEQTQRYKRLVDQKMRHAKHVSQRKCSSGRHCFNQGGGATYPPPRTSPKDPASTYGQFQVNGPGTANDVLNNFSEGAVVAALFPALVPLPPVNRLPAEFECPLCFEVKKFQKPSDWTKHVYEDLQPFTCTFPECNEPKSFKRKADWVRHENEKHRHLEWWACNMPECTHTCHRKDNFVQHLVREHKMTDPKNSSAKSRANKNAHASQCATTAHEQGLVELWRRVDDCRQVTQKQPREEPCRFCGNICSSWKKLTVHLAKHMEQISMPVLELVKQVKVADETDNTGVEYMLQQNSHLSTPVSAQPIPKSGRHIHSPIKAVSDVPIYNTGGLLTEAFGVSQTPLLSNTLRMHNALNGMSHPESQIVSSVGPDYTTSTYTQATTQSVRSEQMYHNQQLYEPSQFVARANSATYPPPFNSLPRQPAMTQQTATTTMPYDLGVNSAVQNAGFVDHQHIFASPIDNLGYVYGQDGEQTGIGQQNSLPYSQNDMTQVDVYIQPDQAQY